MEIKVGLLLLMLFLLPQAKLKTIKGEVIRVQDGDTLTVKTKRDRLYKVRLAKYRCSGNKSALRQASPKAGKRFGF